MPQLRNQVRNIDDTLAHLYSIGSIKCTIQQKHSTYLANIFDADLSFDAMKHQPRRAASIVATSIFRIFIIASNARFASSPPAANASCQNPWRNLPGDSPLILAPAALALLTAITDDCVPVAVGLFLIVCRDLERKSLVMFEFGATVQFSDTPYTGDHEFHRYDIAFLAGRKVVGRAMNAANLAIGKNLRVKRAASSASLSYQRQIVFLLVFFCELLRAVSLCSSTRLSIVKLPFCGTSTCRPVKPAQRTGNRR